MQEARQHGSRTCQYATSTRYMSLYLCAAVYSYLDRDPAKDDMLRLNRFCTSEPIPTWAFRWYRRVRNVVSIASVPANLFLPIPVAHQTCPYSEVSIASVPANLFLPGGSSPRRSRPCESQSLLYQRTYSYLPAVRRPTRLRHVSIASVPANLFLLYRPDVGREIPTGLNRFCTSEPIPTSPVSVRRPA